MGITKTQNYTPDVLIMSNFFKVLGHPARLAILEYLMKSSGCVCGDLVIEIGLSQPTISQHLKELKNIGLIKGSISGSKVCYCIDTKVWENMQYCISPFINQLNINKTNCC